MIDKEKKNNLQLFEDWLSIKYPNVKIDDIFTDDDIVPKDPYYQKYLDDPEVNHSYDYYLIENGQLTCNQNGILTGWSYEDKIDLISSIDNLSRRLKM